MSDTEEQPVMEVEETAEADEEPAAPAAPAEPMDVNTAVQVGGGSPTHRGGSGPRSCFKAIGTA